MAPLGQARLERRLTLRDTVALVAGSVIGVGIFLMPNRVANLVSSPAIMLAIWALAGIVSLFGALTIAELGTRFPQAGGLYVYLREAYGRPIAFLYGWSLLVAIQTGNIASLAAALPIYFGYLVPLSEVATRSLGIGAIVALTAANCLGVRRGALVQNLLTVIKVATLAGMILLLLVASPAAPPAAGRPALDWSWSSLGLAAIAVLYAYECWHLVTFAAGEVVQPSRTIPRGLIAGMALVIALYLSANLAYLCALPVETIRERPEVAAVAMETVVGRAAGQLVSGMILFSVLGAMNGLILSGPRVYYAMACDGMFFKKLASVSENFHVPVYAIVFQGAVAILMTLVASFAQLVAYAISSAWIFYALTVAGLWMVRRRSGDAAPFRCPAYGVLGSVFVAFALFIVVSQLVRQPQQTIAGWAVIGLGLPIYWVWHRRNKSFISGSEFVETK